LHNGEDLVQLAKGLSNKVIARELEIEETTVKLHLRSLFKKLGVNNRTEAVIVARDSGMQLQ
jgi:DNA-binding NarL/FixJ family response regulator